MNAGLILRKQINIKEGGYYYKYEAIPFLDVKEKIKKTMSDWSRDVCKWVDEIEEKDANELINNLI